MTKCEDAGGVKSYPDPIMGSKAQNIRSTDGITIPKFTYELQNTRYNEDFPSVVLGGDRRPVRKIERVQDRPVDVRQVFRSKPFVQVFDCLGGLTRCSYARCLGVWSGTTTSPCNLYNSVRTIGPNVYIAQWLDMMYGRAFYGSLIDPGVIPSRCWVTAYSGMAVVLCTAHRTGLRHLWSCLAPLVPLRFLARGSVLLQRHEREMGYFGGGRGGSSDNEVRGMNVYVQTNVQKTSAGLRHAFISWDNAPLSCQHSISTIRGHAPLLDFVQELLCLVHARLCELCLIPVLHVLECLGLLPLTLFLIRARVVSFELYPVDVNGMVSSD